MGKRFAPYEFSASELRDLTHLLGDRLDKVLPSLEMVAYFYRSSLDRPRVPYAARRELAVLERFLQRTETAIANLTPGANYVLQHTIDETASMTATSWAFVYGIDAVTEANSACARARSIVSKAKSYGAGSWKTALAFGVAGALTGAGLPVSKGRDGLFAKVLVLVWSSVEPEFTPVEVFRHLKRAADFSASRNALPPSKGRPRIKK